MTALLQTPLPALNDPETDHVPESLPAVIDAHVHLFPDHLFKSVWQWFDRYGWPIRYRLTSNQIVEFLLSRGIQRIVGLHYAHRPGLARELNRYMADLCRRYPQLTGMATVFPGEKNAAGILHEAFAFGLEGLKLHAHVQCFDMNDDDMNSLYDICQLNSKPMIMHVGREPKSTAYHCDPYKICSAEKLESVLRNFPKLRICVPILDLTRYLITRN